MKELFTLKDIPGFETFKERDGSDRLIRSEYAYEELQRWGKEWVKELRSYSRDFPTGRFDIHTMNFHNETVAKIEWIMKFFNITEEDLK